MYFPVAVLFVVLGALQIGLMLAVGWSFGPSTGRRALSFGLAFVIPVVPWLLPPEALFFRGLFAVFSLLPMFKWIQMTAENEPGSAARRIWQATAIFDVASTRRVTPRFDRALARHLAGYAGLATFGTGLVLLGTDEGSGLWPLCLLGGLFAVLGIVQSVIDFVRLTHAACGVHVPPIQHEPLRAKSVREFWGLRWNRTVSDWLRAYTFLPLARRGAPALGIVAAFVVSALFHFYIVVVPLGLAPALVMACFFLIQVPVIAIERVAMRGRPAAWRRAFAIVALLATSPLFTGPFSAILAGR